jgi:hypothetical protein
MNRAVFLAPAEEEMLDATRYYERLARRPGEDFLQEMIPAEERIPR